MKNIHEEAEFKETADFQIVSVSATMGGNLYAETFHDKELGLYGVKFFTKSTTTFAGLNGEVVLEAIMTLKEARESIGWVRENLTQILNEMC